MKILLEKLLHLRLAIIALLIIIGGCSMWGNFTTYFNRYYNAEKAFEEAEEEIEIAQKKELFAFKEDKIPSKANQSFEIVIENCSKILQFNKDTKYVNRSIFMIGKAFYYKGQFNKALRKFQELDGLNDEDFMLLNRLWIAKSEMQMRQFTIGLEHLEQVKENAIVKEEEDLLFEAFRTQISYLIYKENYPRAVQAINELLEQSIPDESIAEVIYELGLLYISLNDYENAVVAFKQVEEGSPSFDVEFKSQLEYAKAIKHLDREDESLELLEDLKDDTKNRLWWDMVDLEIAQLHLDRGETELALELFTTIDTTYKKSESAGIAAFMRGDIVEHLYVDFDSAKFLYDRMNTRIAPEEFKIEARKKSNLLKLRSDYSIKIYNAKKEEIYLLDTLLFKSDSLIYAAYEARRDSAEQVDKSNRINQGAAARAQSTSRRNQKYEFVYWEDSLYTYKPVLPKMSLDSVRTFIVKNEYELGNIYFTDLNVADSAYFYYMDVLDNYPNTSYQARTMYALGSYYLTLNENEKADSIFRDVYDNHKLDPAAKAAAARLGLDVTELDLDPAMKKYVKGESKLENEKYFDAIDDFFSIYEEYPKSQFAPKSLYTIGWIYENKLFDNGFAAEYYDTLQTHYPKTEYARSVYSKLSFYKQREKAIQDSLDFAQQVIEDSLKLVALQDSLTQQVIIDSLKLVAQQDSLLHVDSLNFKGSLTDSLITDKDSIQVDVQIQDSTENVISDQEQEQPADSAKANDLLKQPEELQKKTDIDPK